MNCYGNECSSDNKIPLGILSYYLSPLSPWWAVLTCPLWFVVAHLHHCIEKIKNGYTIYQAVVGKFFDDIYVSLCCLIEVKEL